MKQRRYSLAWALLVGCACMFAPRYAHAENALKIAALFPRQSPWGHVVNTWAKAVKERSKDKIQLNVYWNGVQGDEPTVVGKIRSGQLEGAALTSLGLAKIFKPIIALQLPGLFSSWAKLDTARQALNKEFADGAEAKGFRILGWGDGGRMRFFSKGYAVTGPGSLRGHKPFVWQDDEIHRVMFQNHGGIPFASGQAAEILPMLTSGTADAINTPALICEQMQWSSRFDHVMVDTHAYMVGAIIVSKAAFDALPADEQAVLRETGALAGRALTDRIRAEDDTAFARARAKMTTHTLSAAEANEWTALYKIARQRLGQQAFFSPELIQRLEKLGG